MGGCKYSDLIGPIIELISALQTYFVLNKKFRSQVNWECFAICAEESPLDQLFAILAESAHLQISLDQIEGQSPLDTERSCTTLLRRCLETEKKLQDWIRESASKLDGRPAPTKDILKFDPNTIPLGYAVAPYEFSSLQTAKTYILFWVSLLVVRCVYYHTKDILGEPPDPTHMLFCAGEICNSVAYCMQSGRRISAAQVILFGVSQAAQCYIDCGDKERFIWCQGMYPMGKSSGFIYVDCLKQEEYETWNEKHSQSRITY